MTWQSINELCHAARRYCVTAFRLDSASSVQAQAYHSFDAHLIASLQRAQHSWLRPIAMIGQQTGYRLHAASNASPFIRVKNAIPASNTHRQPRADGDVQKASRIGPPAHLLNLKLHMNSKSLQQLHYYLYMNLKTNWRRLGAAYAASISVSSLTLPLPDQLSMLSCIAIA